MSISDEVRRDRKMADINADIGQAKRERMLEAVKDGMRIGDAREAGDMKTDQAYRYHRKKHPKWAAQIDFALNAAKELASSSVPPSMMCRIATHSGS